MGTRQGYRGWFELWERRDDNVTMNNVFQFGEEHPDYPVRVLNETYAVSVAGPLSRIEKAVASHVRALRAAAPSASISYVHGLQNVYFSGALKPFVDGLADAKAKLKSATGVFFKPKYALNSQFEVFGRLGWASTKLKFSNANASAEDSGNDFAWGLGASYKIMPGWSASLDYTRYYNKNSGSISGIGVNVGYRF